MKNKIIILGLLVTIICLKIHANDNIRYEDSITRQLFVKSEKIAIRNRAKIEKIRFLDPIERDMLFFRIVKKESPDLINNTNKYKYGLINLLRDKTIRKDDYSDFDVINILYNLCIDDYIEVIDSIYPLVKKTHLKFDILERLILQDFNVTNQVARNYKNPKLQQFLKQLKQEIKSGKVIIPEGNYGFMEELNKLISGDAWEKDLKKDEILHPPLLNSQDCR